MAFELSVIDKSKKKEAEQNLAVSGNEAPAKIYTDVNNESWEDGWYSGYDLGVEDCERSSVKLHKQKYQEQKHPVHNPSIWEESFEMFLPSIVCLGIILAVVCAVLKNQRCTYKKMNDEATVRLQKSLDNQLKLISEQEKTNALLQKILDKNI